MLVRGFIYLSKDDHQLVKISLSLNKKINKLLFGTQLIYRTILCKYPHKAFDKFKKGLSSNFEISYKGDNFFIGDINAMLIAFDEITKKLVINNQGVWYGKSNLSIDFPNYKDDISHYGQKRLFKISWKNRIIKYIVQNKIKKILFDDIEHEEILQYLEKLRDHNVIKSNHEYNLTNKAFISTLNEDKEVITLVNFDRQITKLMHQFNIQQSVKDTSTYDCINNVLMKNATLKLSGINEHKYMYCTVKQGEYGINTLIIDTVGMRGVGAHCDKITISIKKFGDKYYPFNTITDSLPYSQYSEYGHHNNTDDASHIESVRDYFEHNLHICTR